MDRRLKILFIILVYFIVCGKSCVDEKSRTAWELKQVDLARDSIRLEFEAGYLSEDARFAAEITAIQKLEDLANYIEIYTDVSMDSVFREKAGDMIRGMFVSEDSQLSFGPMIRNKMKCITLKEFMEKGLGEDVLKSEIIFDSIQVKEPLQKSGEDMYSGMLAAYQTVIILNPADSIISPSILVTIHFISSKKTKIFGQDTLQTWEVAIRGILHED